MASLIRKSDGCLDRQSIRIGAVYRMMARGTVGGQRAVELLEQRGVKMARQTVERWSFKIYRSIK